MCITIRTAVIERVELHVQTGSGHRADSDPAAELAETEAKAAAVLAVAGAEARRR